MVAVDTVGRTVTTRSGAQVAYDRLLLATGGKPFVPKIDGLDAAGVFTFTSYEDARRVDEYIESQKACEAVVLGGGMIGLKAADALLARGLKVTIVELADRLLVSTLDRTASLPKSARFTFGQRLDNLTLDALLLVTRAIFSPRPQKAALLRELNLLLELLRVLWRLVEQRAWISRQQLLFVNGRIDEIGRMTGGWLQSLPGER